MANYSLKTRFCDIVKLSIDGLFYCTGVLRKSYVFYEKGWISGIISL